MKNKIQNINKNFVSFTYLLKDCHNSRYVKTLGSTIWTLLVVNYVIIYYF